MSKSEGGGVGIAKAGFAKGFALAITSGGRGVRAGGGWRLRSLVITISQLEGDPSNHGVRLS